MTHCLSWNDDFSRIASDVTHGHFGDSFSFAHERTCNTNHVFPFKKTGCTYDRSLGIEFLYCIEIKVSNACMTVIYQVLS